MPTESHEPSNPSDPPALAAALTCELCAAREKAIAEGRWNVEFRFCPHCGATWSRHAI